MRKVRLAAAEVWRSKIIARLISVPSLATRGDSDVTVARERPSSGEETAYSNAPLRIPIFDHQRSAMGIQMRLSKDEASNVERVYESYMMYFEHVRFRNKWAEPAFEKSTISPLFREAAEHVVRIRRFLDLQNAAQKLRKADGEAQAFLHTDEAQALFKNNPRQFIVGVVKATFNDAVGYVEGLTEERVDRFLFELTQYQFNPRTHAQHLIRALDEVVSSIPLPPEVAAALPKELAGAKDTTELEKRLTALDNEFYCPGDSPDDKEWRSIIRDLYQLLGRLEKRRASHGS